MKQYKKFSFPRLQMTPQPSDSQSSLQSHSLLRNPNRSSVRAHIPVLAISVRARPPFPYAPTFL
jgi:hypothetical protein